MDNTLDVAELLVTCVAAADTAVSIADANDPELPLIYVNPAFERLTGYRAEHVLGRNARFLQGPGTAAHTVRAISGGLRDGRFVSAQLVNYRADGSAFWVDLRISAVRDQWGAVTRYVSIQHDVTAQVVAQQQAEHAATREPLTGLMNRVSFAEQLQREVARAARSDCSVGVLFLDIDDFKAVNDTYGHMVGDGFLLHIAETLRQRLRGQDAAARVGGDEFLALLSDLPGDGVDASAHVVADLRRALAGPFMVDGVEYLTRVSVGTALYPRDGTTVRDLIARADDDMYRHKPPQPGHRNEDPGRGEQR